MPASLASNTVLYKQQGLNTEALRGRKKKMLGQSNHNSISDNTLEIKQKRQHKLKCKKSPVILMRKQQRNWSRIIIYGQTCFHISAEQ